MTDEAESKGERVAKALARAGVASRREVERFIEAGRVAINGQVLTSPAVNVMPGDILTFDKKVVDEPEALAGLSLAAREVVAAGQCGEGSRRQLGVSRPPLPVAGHLREPCGISHQIDRGQLQAAGFAHRTDLAEVTAFVSALVQADEVGLSIGRTLAVQAEQIRLRRRQRAERLAREASIKMLFPMALLIFPAIFVVILVPAMPTIFETLRSVGR